MVISRSATKPPTLDPGPPTITMMVNTMPITINDEKIKNYSKFRKELIQILNEVSKDHFKLIPLLVAGSFRDEWDEIKFQIDEYQFLEKQKPSEKEDLEKLIQSLWKAMNKIEKVFPYEEEEVSSTAYSLEDYGSID